MNPGLYNYWSGYVDNQKISFRGVVKVENYNNKELRLDVTQNGFIGIYLDMNFFSLYN